VLKRFLPRIFDAEVTEAGSVADALTKLDGAPHLALLDLGLPDGDGAEVARALRERYGREVLLVATSGYDGSRVHPLLRDGTFDAFLPKPASLGQIETLLNNLFSRSPTRSEALALTRQ
jgi:CheY-like chemotaxis protein